MPKGKPKYCECGCGVTPTTYREKFLEFWSSGYPCLDSGMYYCSRYGQTDKHGYTCWSVVSVSDIDKTYHIDHIEPKARGGADCIHNLRIMCAHCNTSKKHDDTKSAKACAKLSSKGIANYVANNIDNAKKKRPKNKSKQRVESNTCTDFGQDFIDNLDFLANLKLLEGC